MREDQQTYQFGRFNLIATYKGILMANDGYGTAKVIGTTDEDRHEVVSTEGRPMSAEVPATSDKATKAGLLLEKFQQIWDRIRS